MTYVVDNIQGINALFSESEAEKPYAVCIQGDDDLGIMSSSISPYFEAICVSLHSMLGFKLKFLKVTPDLFELDYCSRNFYYTQAYPGFILLPKPFKVLAKVCYSTTSPRDLIVHNRGIALGLFNDSRNVPYLREYVDRILQITDGVEAEPQYNPFSIHASSILEMDTRNYELVCERYDLSHAHLTDFTQALELATCFPFFIGDFVTQRLIELDA